MCSAKTFGNNPMYISYCAAKYEDMCRARGVISLNQISKRLDKIIEILGPTMDMTTLDDSHMLKIISVLGDSYSTRNNYVSLLLRIAPSEVKVQKDKFSHWSGTALYQPKEVFLNTDQIHKVRTAAEGHEDQKIRRLVSILLSTGQRIEAAVNLTWTRVNLEANTLDFRPVLKRQKGGGIVPITYSLKVELERTPKNFRRGYVISDDMIWHWTTAQYHFKKFMKELDLEWVTPHVIRHTVAAHMAMNGVPMYEISKFLGHKSITVTEKVYAKFTPEYMKKSLEFLNGLTRD